MGRGKRTERWIAASGGVLINGLLLAALVLIDQAPPMVEDQPIITLELERLQRHRTPRNRAPSARAAATSSPAKASTLSGDPEGEGPPAMPSAQPTPPEIDPAWRVDPKAVERWRLTEGVPEWGWGRYYRACKGLSSEHMTDEEKDRCYSGWYDKPTDKRPSPKFIGPIDERKWEAFERPPPPPPDKEFQRQERCRTYRGGRVGADPSSMPSLREGGCF